MGYRTCAECLVGTRWEDKDWRDAGRVIEIVSVTQDRVTTRVVAATASKQYTLGRESLMSLNNLRRRYREAS